MNILHVHSVYSQFDAVQTPDDICRKAKELGAKSVTLTDHGSLLGIDDFMEAGAKYGINAVPGVEAYCENKTHLVLFAKNYRGFQAISAAMKEANTRIEKVGEKLTYPIMGDDILERYFKGNADVIATSACIQGPVGYILQHDRRVDRKAAKPQAVMEANLPQRNVYLEAEKEVKELSDALRERKKQRTADSKFTKPAFLKKMQKLEDKLAVMGEDDKRYEKTLSDLYAAKSQHTAAVQLMESHESAIAEMTAALAAARAKKNGASSAKTKYVNAEKKAAAILSEKKGEKELYEEAKGRLLYLKSIFPEFYAELQYHGLEAEAYVMPLLLKIARETDTQLVAANDAHMEDGSANSIEARRIMRFNYFETSEEVNASDRELYIKGEAELSSALSYILPGDAVSEAIANTAVLDMCRVVFPKGEHYPKTDDGVSLDQLIGEAVERKKKEGTWTKAYEERLTHELSVIKSMGYVDYHLVVRDYCNAGRILGVVPKERRSEIPDDFNEAKAWIEKEGFKDGVGIGPGRGSAAGSLVCYLLGITNIDPMKYGLLFERFLNPERVSMPDIDTDVATSLRGTVIRYLVNKYGKDAVSSIATVTTYGAKGALQMAGRERANQIYASQPKTERRALVSRYQSDYTYKISDAIPAQPNAKLSDFESQLSGLIHSSPEMQLIWEHAKLIEGKVCGTGVHAGGIVISDNGNINEYVPQAWNEKNKVWVAQCDMIRIEDKGLLKMDLLGLQTLDIITDCLQLIGKYDGKHIDMDNIPFEAEVFSEIYAKGNTNSVFQFESGGMKSMLREFKPTSFEDLILLVAAYRPGPMQYLDNIIEVKNGRMPLTYKHPMLEEILSKTYGAVIYQEQVMQIFQKLAGYSLGGADLVRRAMSKKKMEKLAKERGAFIHGDPERGIDGCVKRGVSEKVADELFDEMMDFARYAFNKSHAAAYAFVSYQTAYLKYHYPAEFACAMFNNTEQKEFGPVLADCTRYGVRLLPPGINTSSFDFTLEKEQDEPNAPRVHFSVRFGIRGLNGIGDENRALVDSIVEEKRANGDYTSVQDFLLRTIKREEQEDGRCKCSLFPQAFFKKFAETGLFDFCGKNREAILEAFTPAYEQAAKAKTEAKTEEDLAGLLADICIDSRKMDKSYNSAKEAENLGTMVSERPLDKYKAASCYHCIEICDLEKANGDASIFGILTGYKELVTKKGYRMLAMEIHGKTGAVNVLAFDPVYDKCLGMANAYLYKVIKVEGHVNKDSLIVTRMGPMLRATPRLVVPYISNSEREFIGSLGKDAIMRKDNPVKVTFLSWQNANGKVLKKPVTYCFTAEAVRACQKHGIRFADPDRSV